MEKAVPKQRDSNIELFRICCMIGITLQHMMLHTNALESTDMYVRIWAQFFNIFAKAGVNGFVMITAWYTSAGGANFERIKYMTSIRQYGGTALFSVSAES
ncbi:MAG: hypothetical protein LUI01_04365 [Firmicutes bacterium]|nr:hypothetical protein [Bacillota bacterium]